MTTHENRDESVSLGEGAIHNSARATMETPTIAVIALIFSCISIPLCGVAIYVALWSVKEYKQVQVQLMYTNAIMLREGMVQSGDMVYGPEGNLEYKQHELRKK